MIRAVVLLIFVAVLAFTPVYLLENKVLPQLSGLKQVYGSASEMADQMSGVDSATAASAGGVDSH